MNLNDGFARRRRVVVHTGVEVSETAGRETHHLAGIELIAHPHFQGAGENRHIFAMRMGVRRNPVTVRHLESNREVAGGGHGITL